jgi:hypothetical protein
VLLAIEKISYNNDRFSGEYFASSFSSFQALLKLTCGTTSYAEKQIKV